MRALSVSKPLQIIVLIVAAMLEVGGDALIRRGLRASGAAFVVLGFVVLGPYGIVVNLLDLDFSRMLGIYAGLFALVSVLAGRILFAEQIAPATWIGLCVVLTGSA